MKRGYTLLIAVLLAFVLTFGGCALNSPPGAYAPPPAAPGANASGTTPPTTNTATPTSPATTSLADIEAALEHIYTQVNPSVVNISVLKRQAAFPGFPGSPFQGPGQFEQGLGSGFVWDNLGHIVTNNHVVADADNITVTFYDGTTVPGKMIGTDADSDLAVVKVDMPADQIQPVQMADSTQSKVGHLAIAIGNPFGLQGTMTVGFISALGRVLPANENAIGPSYSLPDIIQTDAAINPGNSGGVLLDDTGKVIGVTSSIVSASGTSSGVGFAIPSAIVQKVIPVLIQTGRYSHPYLGVSLASLNPDIASAMNLPLNQRGALVIIVTEGSPADKAGLQAGQNEVTIQGQRLLVGGDVIVAYNDQVVKSADDLVTFLARSGSAGQAVNLTVLRGTGQVQLQVILGVRPSP